MLTSERRVSGERRGGVRNSSSAYGSQAYCLCFRHCVLSLGNETVVCRLAKDTGIEVDVESLGRRIGRLKVQFDLESLYEEDFLHPS